MQIHYRLIESNYLAHLSTLPSKANVSEGYWFTKILSLLIYSQ